MGLFMTVELSCALERVTGMKVAELHFFRNGQLLHLKCHLIQNCESPVGVGCRASFELFAFHASWRFVKDSRVCLADSTLRDWESHTASEVAEAVTKETCDTVIAKVQLCTKTLDLDVHFSNQSVLSLFSLTNYGSNWGSYSVVVEDQLFQCASSGKVAEVAIEVLERER